MRVTTILFTAFLLLLSQSNLCAQSAEEEVGTIVCQVHAFRNSKGSIKLTLYNRPEGFPEDLRVAVATKKIKVSGHKYTEVRFRNVPYGQYAIAGLHDENDSSEMDYNWLGLPKEGYCFSNDAEPFLSAPSFEAARFVLQEEKKVVRITMQY